VKKIKKWSIIYLKIKIYKMGIYPGENEEMDMGGWGSSPN